jgi:DNA polymerase-3 subunit delta'
MSLHNSYIYICENIEEKEAQLKDEFKPKRVVSFVREKFLIDDAKEVIAEAYKSEADTKYIIFGAYEINVYSQNALLKILEEPPKNIVFILLSPSKSALLPTIRSRLPIKKELSKKEDFELDIDLKKLDLDKVFNFLQTYKNSSKNEAKIIIETLYKKALYDGIKLNKKQLENFDMAYRLLELNSRVLNVLSLIMMGFLHED